MSVFGDILAVIRTAAGSLQAQAADSAIAGGNARGANAVDWQAVRAAATQVASGATAVIGGGVNNLASGTNSMVAGGRLNAATASEATVAGGNGNAASGLRSWVPGGWLGTTRGLHGVGAWAAGQFSSAGDAQAEEHLLRRQTTDATATRLTADAAVAGPANTINLADLSLIAGRLIVEARAVGANLAAAWYLDVSAFRDSGAGTTAMMGGGGTAITPTHSRGLGSAWRLDVAADTTNGGIALTVTGAAATTIDWVARYSAVQVQT